MKGSAGVAITHARVALQSVFTAMPPFWSQLRARALPFLLARLRARSNRLAKERKKCHGRVKTIAGRLLRDFRGSMGDEGQRLYAEELALIERTLRQKRHDKNKVYSLHDPQALVDPARCAWPPDVFPARSGGALHCQRQGRSMSSGARPPWRCFVTVE